MITQKYGYIYETTNLVNGKKYIGRHKSSEFDKNYIGSGRHFCNAVNKYGKNNFSVRVLEWCYSEEELTNREKYYINHDDFDAVLDKMYYNESYGSESEGWSGVNKMFKNNKNKLDDMIAKVQLHRRINGTNKLTEEHKRKISESTTGLPKPNNRNLIYINKDGINKRVLEKDIDSYIKDGWVLGRDCSLFIDKWSDNLSKSQLKRFSSPENRKVHSDAIKKSWEKEDNYKSIKSRRGESLL